MLKTFSITDIGRKRKVNQDYIYTSEEPVGNLPNVFIVADGMGGHNAGDYASKVTVETMLAEMQSSFEKNPTLIFRRAIEEANEVIRRRADEDKKLEGMGTTVVVASCMGRFLQVANVGDSRLYVVNRETRQITRDHSLVEEMIRMGGEYYYQSGRCGGSCRAGLFYRRTQGRRYCPYVFGRTDEYAGR